MLRLRSLLREYFPAALAAFADLAAPDTLELLARTPEPQAAARPSKAADHGGAETGRRCCVADRAAAIQATLRAPQLAQPSRAGRRLRRRGGDRASRKSPGY
jgi:hypothetical protein